MNFLNVKSLRHLLVMNFFTHALCKLWDVTLEKKTQEYYECILAVVPYVQGVPKSIYQTNYTKQLKPEIEASIAKMMAINSQWSHRLFDDKDIEEFIKANYGEVIWGYYTRIHPFYGAARADFFRYLLIYKLGGVYIDIKTCILGDLDSLLSTQDSFLISYWDNEPGDLHEGQTFLSELSHIARGEYVQWCIISSPGHPLMRAVILRILSTIDRYNPYKMGMGFEGTIRTTGPVPYTLAIEQGVKHGEKRYRWVSFAKDLGIQYSIYESNGRSLAHKGILKSNYHNGKVPVITHPNLVVRLLSKGYIGALSMYREWKMGHK